MSTRATREQSELAFTNFVCDVLDFGTNSEEEQALRELKMFRIEELANMTDESIDALSFTDGTTKKDVAGNSKNLFLLGRDFLKQSSIDCTDPSTIAGFTRDGFQQYRHDRRTGSLPANPAHATGANVTGSPCGTRNSYRPDQ